MATAPLSRRVRGRQARDRRVRGRRVRRGPLALAAGVALVGAVLGATPSSAAGTAAPVADGSPAIRTARPVAGDTDFGAVVKPREGEDWPQALTRAETDYGHLAVIRYFDNNLPDSWSSIRSRLTNHTLIASFKAPPKEVLTGQDDAKLLTWFRNAPTSRTTWYSYIHEPEDNVARGEFTAADYRAASAHIASLAHSVGNPDLHSTLILQCYTVNPTSGRHWMDYYAGSGSIDYLGWDCYNHATKNAQGYGKPADLFGRAVATSQAAGLPWGIAEVGSTLAPGDDGTGRAAWLTAMSKYLFNQRATFVSYFDTNGAGTDYRLLDAPSQQAWYDVVSDQLP